MNNIIKDKRFKESLRMYIQDHLNHTGGYPIYFNYDNKQYDLTLGKLYKLAVKLRPKR